MSEEVNPTPVTEVDEALMIARANPGQSNFFYDAFLNAEVFMPVRKQGTEQGTWTRMGGQDRFQPLFLNYEDKKVVPVFDQLDRLKNWAQGKDLDYVQLKAHTLLVMFAPEIGMSLNLSTAFTYYFSPEMLGRLRQAMKPVTSN